MCEHGVVEDHLSPLGASFLYLEEPTTVMHVGSVLVLDPGSDGLDVERFMSLVQARIVGQPLAGAHPDPHVRAVGARGDLVRLPLAGEHDAPRAGVLTRRDVTLTAVCEAIIATCELQAMRGEFDRAFVRPYLPQDF